jgi:hypothetical protein
VLVDGKLIASRKKSFLSHFLGGGWPKPDDVAGIVREQQRLAT